jgi:hypothetical protein
MNVEVIPVGAIHTTSVLPSVLLEGSWFQKIPPERIGLQGEYDYYGLAKRVRHRLREVVGLAVLHQVKIRQRGRVIVLVGCVTSAEVLETMLRTVLSVEGADAVETYGLSLTDPSACMVVA